MGRSAPADDLIGPLTITDIAHGGYGVARLDGRVVFVTGTLPGERVFAEVLDRRSRLWFARCVDVVGASPDRVEHIWPLAARTGVGGADLGHVALPAQRRWKAKVVADQLRRIAHLEPGEVVVEAAPGDDARGGLAWRTRIDCVVDDAGRLAMRQVSSTALVPLDSMPLAHEAIQAAAPWGSEWAPGRRYRFLAPGDGRGSHTSADTASSAERSPGPGSPGNSVRVVDLDDPTPPEVTWTVTQDQTNRPEGASGGLASGTMTWRYSASASGFWQAHREAPSVLLGAVLDAVGDVDGATVLDLYCGAGLFTVPLARAAGARGTVVGIDGDQTAAGFARKNVRRHAAGAEVVTGDVARVLAARRPELRGRGVRFPARVPDRADVVVCDPPRSGAGARVVDAIVAHAPRRVVYVACDPAALARDVACFATHGYALSVLRAIDLFPMTHHVEVVATLEPR